MVGDVWSYSLLMMPCISCRVRFPVMAMMVNSFFPDSSIQIPFLCFCSVSDKWWSFRLHRLCASVPRSRSWDWWKLSLFQLGDNVGFSQLRIWMLSSLEATSPIFTPSVFMSGIRLSMALRYRQRLPRPYQRTCRKNCPVRRWTVSTERAIR